MEFSQEQTEQIKKQLIQQIENTFPDDKKESAKQQIMSMDEKQLKEFLEKNRLIKTQKQNPEENIFRSIVSGKVDSYKINENKSAIAVLEINPVSKGHVLVIPKKPLKTDKKIPKTITNFIKKIENKLKDILKPKEISIAHSKIFGEVISNLVPIYKDKDLKSERRQAKKQELEELQNILTEEPKKEIKKIRKPRIKKIKEKNLWLPKRIP